MAERVVKYILSGDSRSAVRAFKETGDAGEKTGKKLKKTGEDTDKSFAAIEHGAHKMRGAVGLLAGAAGLGGLAFGIKDAVEAATQWQSQQAQLRNALKNTGQASVENIKRINEAVDASATHGGFKGQEEVAGIAQFVRLTHDSSKAMKLNAEAVNFARGAHVDYSEAVRMVSQIQTGNTGRLQKYLGIIQPVHFYVKSLTAAQKAQNPQLLQHAILLDKQATAQKANVALMQKFGGASQAYSHTAAGAISNTQHAIELLAEKVGLVLLPYVAKAARALTGVVDVVIQHWPQIKAQVNDVIGVVKQVVGWFQRHLDVTKALAAGLATIAAAYVAYTLAMKAAVIWQAAYTAGTKALIALQLLRYIKSWRDAWILLNLVMDANPIGIVVVAIAALVAGVVYAYLHFKTFRNVVNSVFSWLKGAVHFVVDFVSKHWKLLALVIAGPLAPILLILTHLREVKKIVGDIIGFGGKAVKGVVGKIGGFLGFADGGIVPGFATGGIIGRGTDTVPAMLTPGEGILTTRAVQAIGGARGVNALNAGAVGGGASYQPITLPITLVAADGGRALAEGLAHYTLKLGSRR